ncbi:MAG: hypothetical protein M3R70_05015 [Actinomycetota bacterium]|nr:hypothetical protein [Actinomycetota bacterium]
MTPSWFRDATPAPDAGEDDRPPICPSCGVTMGMQVEDDGKTSYVCLECGFADDCEQPRR